MNDTTKSFLKRTILGLVGGGAISALYAMNSSKKDKENDADSAKDEIVVPLSRKNFLKAVRPERLSGDKVEKTTPKSIVSGVSDADIAAMSPKDLASLKKSILRKKAECSGGGKCGKVSKCTTSSYGTVPVRRIAGAGSTFPRDKKGRFVSDGDTTKSAGLLTSLIPGLEGAMNDAGDVMASNIGLIGGTAAGMVAMKMISDRILINRRKKQVEEARRLYADSIANEVNDEDLPYYRKTADDHGMFGSALGYLGLAGLTAGTAAAAVMYRIMENRRKEEEKAKDKDLSKYPTEKSIRFRFPDSENTRFFA